VARHGKAWNGSAVLINRKPTEIGSYVGALVRADSTVNAVAQALSAAGGEVFAVGGVVRDALLGVEPNDIDLLVTGLQATIVREYLERLPGRIDLTGKAFGVFRYKDGGEVEVSLPRRERSTGTGLDVEADSTLSVEDDLYRRDFTANAMAVDLASGRLIDPFGGVGDLADGQFRTLNRSSLADDPVRTLRALVLSARYGLSPDTETRDQLGLYAHYVDAQPTERVQYELDKVFEAVDPAGAIRLAQETGVLVHVLPEVAATFGYDQQNPHHELELGEHIVNVLDRCAKRNSDRDVRLAALLHDIGKPASAWIDPVTGSKHYYESRGDDGVVLGADHAVVGAQMANALMWRLHYPADRIARVTAIVAEHMYAPFTTTKGARRFLARVGDHADDLLALRRADSNDEARADTEHSLIEEVRSSGEATSRLDLAIRGDAILALGVEPGPRVGAILRHLTESVLDEPSLNDPNSLLDMARELIRTPGQTETFVRPARSFT
jgi:tRNA nucleotidyltransferase (CCA-adding enzyme)